MQFLGSRYDAVQLFFFLTPTRSMLEYLLRELVFGCVACVYSLGYYFFSAQGLRTQFWALTPSPRSNLLFYDPRPKLLFCGLHVPEFIFQGPEFSKLLFHDPVGRKHFLYFCILKLSNFSIKGR